MKPKKINLKLIFEGFCNLFFKKKTPLYYARKRICSTCEHRNGKFCSVCGCYIKAKISVNYPLDKDGISMGGCPLFRW